MNQHTIRLLLVDNSLFFREGLAALINLEKDIEVIGEASNYKEAVLVLEKSHIDLMLIDSQILNYNSGEIKKKICQQFPCIRIISLVTFDGDEYIFPSLQNGSLAYILKGTPSKKIAATIRNLFRVFKN